MTDAEFWNGLATYLERSGMPKWPDGSGPTYGLCGCISISYEKGRIGMEQRFRLMEQLECKYGHLAVGASNYYWVPGETEPRIKACRELAACD